MLKKFNLDSVYAGQTEVDGEHFMVEDVEEGPGAFRACLDVGLSRTSTGANVFGAMKVNSITINVMMTLSVVFSDACSSFPFGLVDRSTAAIQPK